MTTRQYYLLHQSILFQNNNMALNVVDIYGWQIKCHWIFNFRIIIIFSLRSYDNSKYFLKIFHGDLERISFSLQIQNYKTNRIQHYNEREDAFFSQGNYSSKINTIFSPSK